MDYILFSGFFLVARGYVWEFQWSWKLGGGLGWVMTRQQRRLPEGQPVLASVQL